MRGVLVLVVVLAGCVTTEPLPAGESFRFDVSCRGNGGERTVVADVTADFGSPLGQEVLLDDKTTGDDSVKALRRIRIGGLRPQTGRRAAPTSGHIEWRELAMRSPIELVLEYKGHRDVYHMTFPPRGGVLIEPASGDFSRVFVKP